MKSESIAYVIAGICFGIILGWVIGTQQARRAGSAPAPTTAATQPASGSTAQQQAPKLDEGRVQALSTILKSDPKNVNATIQLGNVYFDAERWDDAIKWYEKAVELDPRNADAHVNLGRLLQERGRVEEAVLQYEEALRLSPKHAPAAYNLGTALEDLKRTNAAIAAYRRAIALDEQLADAHYNLSRLYEKIGQRQAALRHLSAYRDLVR